MLITQEVSVRHDRGSYSVRIGSGALCSEVLGPTVSNRRVFVVSSERIRSLHGEQLERALGEAGRFEWLIVPDGEAAKNVTTAEFLWNRLLDRGGKRDSLVVAFGGGSVGDLAGFVAATFLRGIDFVQVPTTLLAQVDASVGGKVAVDLAGGKNTVGAFHQPRLVIADVDLLSTLESRDLASGLAESIKMAAILDLEMLARIENSLSAMLARDTKALAEVVADSVRVKAQIVEDDPFEGDRRRLLNFGHTLGHAIEVSLAYQDLRHGEAVAWGMLFAIRLSRLRGLSSAEAQRLERTVRRLQLPALPELNCDVLLDACSRDKKAKEGSLSWVLCSTLGVGTIVEDLGNAEIRGALVAFLSESPSTGRVGL